MRALAIFAALAVAACSGGDDSPPHPTDRLDFPVSVTVDPSGQLVWVVSGAFDLAYRGAGILAIDVATNQFVPALAFEVGGFPGPVKLLERDGKAVAAYVTSRDEDRLYFATFPDHAADGRPSSVDCPGAEDAEDDAERQGILRCPKSGAIRSATVQTDDGAVELTLGDDPFGLVVSPRPPGVDSKDLLLSAAMADGRLATFELGDDGTPELVGNVNLLDGLFSLARHPVTGRIYGTSKLANVLSVLELGARPDPDRPADPDARDRVNPWVTQVATVAIPEPAARDRARAVAVSRDGTRLYAAYRAPDSLVILDIADTATGDSRARVLAKVPMDNDPDDVVVVPQPDGGELVYVSCFRANRIEVVDPVSGAIVAGIHTGDGPSGMAYLERDLGGGTILRRLYVALFNDDAVGVVELDPASPLYHTEVAEIR